ALQHFERQRYGDWDKLVLASLIEEANQLHLSAIEGLLAGMYEYGAKAEFQTAISDAELVYNNPSLPDMIDEAVLSLRMAMDEFESKYRPYPTVFHADFEENN